ncbi:MAG TPA: TlpA disulfide reductase family protein, partial [Cyclobacteriaceae bacterium]|nr:TlpA disulfide reductase family protein [Cyclobacteriaceae bacterium]
GPVKPGKNKLFRELAEWGIIVLIFAALYFTGLHTVVIGTMQSIVLKTGLIRPNLHPSENLGYTEFDFLLKDISGQTLDVRTLKGKTIFLNFWATWCPPCIAEMPDIEKLYKNVKGEGIVFLMVSVDDDFEKAKKFAEKRNLSMKIYAPDSGIPTVFTSRTIPSTYVISPGGKIVMKREGMARYNSRTFRNFLKELD